MSKRINAFSLMVAGALVLSPALALAQGGGASGGAAGTGGNTAPPATGVEQPNPSGMNKSSGTAPAASPTSPSGVSGTTSSSGAMSSPSASPAGGDFMGRHTMSGEVTRIDGKSGKFSLKTKDGMMLDLHAPPSALSGVKSGDQLSVEIAVKPVK